MLASELCELAEASGVLLSLTSSVGASWFAPFKESSTSILDDSDGHVVRVQKADLAPDLVSMADAMADLDYVTTGGFVEAGLPQEELGEEIHDSNMSKLGEDGKPVHDPHGKVVKGPNFRLPDIASVLARACRGQRYVMRWTDYSYEIVGPFASKDEAYLWATHTDNNPDDDPRWQQVQLKEPDAPPVCRKP